MHLLQISELLISKARSNQNCSDLLKLLAAFPEKQLFNQLPTDEHKKVFWINLYNALILLDSNGTSPDILPFYKRWYFYERKRVRITTHHLSLHDIEHGILRRSKTWWGRGYVPRLETNYFIRKCRAHFLDARIHFTLNCGSKGCPSIRYYNLEKIEEQLNMASRAYLLLETKITDHYLQIPRIFAWYLGDFAGFEGVKAFIKKHHPEWPEGIEKIKFK